jgi:hypothetical protein
METGRKHHRLWAGLLVVTGSVGLIFAGAFAAIARSDGMYVALGGHGTYRTDRYGLATGAKNWQSELLGWTGLVKLKFASVGSKPIFVGVAPADAMRLYLAAVGYTTVGAHTHPNRPRG